jgi:hypothetical protein
MNYIGTVLNNYGIKQTVYVNLPLDTILVCKKTTTAKTSLGASNILVNYEQFIPGKKYKIDHNYRWGYKLVSYVRDEDGTCMWATPELFDIDTDTEITKTP